MAQDGDSEIVVRNVARELNGAHPAGTGRRRRHPMIVPNLGEFIAAQGRLVAAAVYG